METLLYTFTPSILALFLIFFLDRNREPIITVLIILFAGFLLCLPAGLLNTYLPPIIGLGEDDAFIAGFTEEPLKFLAFLMFVKSRKEFNEPMDAVVYGALLSIGFATFENYEYVYLYEFEVEPLAVAIFRAFTAVPLHICCGIIMGYFLASGFYRPTIVSYCQALFVPVIIHSVYNYIDTQIITVIFMIILLILTLVFHKRVRQMQIKHG